MIETPTVNFNISLGCEMAGSATPYGTRKALSLPLWTSLEVVTDETVDLVNSEMGSLNQLGMTGRASKLHPSSQLTYVFFMGEAHILIDHISLKIFNLVASFL
jgi:hypothetical protein